MAFHALHLLFRLARQPDDAPLSASELAANCGISEHFIQKIMRSLQGRGLVRSIRGIAGGHVLARAPGEISLADIVIAVEGGIKFPEIKGDGLADNIVADVWSTAGHRILQELRAVTLTDVFELHDRLTARQSRGKRGRAADTAAARQLPLSLGRLRCRRPRRMPRTAMP